RLQTADTLQTVSAGGRQFQARLLSLGMKGLRRQILTWYWVDGRYTADPYAAKLLQLEAKLGGGPPAAAIVSVSLDYRYGAGRADAARRALVHFAGGLCGLEVASDPPPDVAGVLALLFPVLFLAMALWEALAPARIATQPAAARWFGNVSLFAMGWVVVA